jgi:hypothetical protein
MGGLHWTPNNVMVASTRPFRQCSTDAGGIPITIQICMSPHVAFSEKHAVFRNKAVQRCIGIHILGLAMPGAHSDAIAFCRSLFFTYLLNSLPSMAAVHGRRLVFVAKNADNGEGSMQYLGMKHVLLRPTQPMSRFNANQPAKSGWNSRILW